MLTHSLLIHFLATHARPFFLTFLESRRRLRPMIQDAQPSIPFELTRSLIREIKSTAEFHGATFMVVTTSRFWDNSFGIYEAFIQKLISDGIQVLDVETLPGFEQRMNIPGDGHWNALGHQFVAEQLKKFIQNNILYSQ